MVDRIVRVSLVGDASSLINAANSARNALSGLANVNLGTLRASTKAAGAAAGEAEESAKSWAEALKTGLAVVGIEAGWSAVVDGFKAAIASGLAYQENLNTLAAVTGATTAEMSQMSQVAQALGRDLSLPGANAATAAEAMKELAKGGFSVQQSMNAARGTLLLATAAGISGADAATIQAKALNSFRMEASQAGDVANLLANASIAASGEITDMAMALQQSATVAAGFGISLDDTNNMIGLFAKNGVIGSDAGTSFKTMLSALASPTKSQAAAMDKLNLSIYDQQGNFVGMKALIGQLETAYNSMTVEQYNAAAGTLFGTDAIRAANIAAQEGVDGYNDMNIATHKANGAQEIAAAQTKGLVGALGNFYNKVSDVATQLFTRFQPAMESAVNSFAWLTGVIGGGLNVFSGLPTPFLAFAGAATAAVLLRGPLMSLWASIQSGARGAKAGVLGLRADLTAIKLDLATSRAAAAATGASFSTMGRLATIAGVNARVAGSLMKAAFMSNPIGLALVGITTALSIFMSTTEDATQATVDFSDVIDKNTGALVANASALIAPKIPELIAGYRALGGAAGDMTLALQGNPEALDRVNTLLLDQATAAVEASVEWQGLVASGANGGMTAREFASGLLAGKEELSDITPAMAAVIKVSDGLASGTRDLTGAQEAAKLAAEDTAAANEALAKSTGPAALSAKDYADILNTVEEALGKGLSAGSAFKSTIDALKYSTSEATLAAEGLSAAWAMSASGSAVRAAAATRDTDSAMRDVTTSHRSYEKAVANVATKQKALNDLQDHGTLSAKDLAQAQESVADAAKSVSDAQADVLKTDAENAKKAVEAQEEIAKARAEAARNNQDAQNDLRTAYVEAAKDEQDAAEKLAETEAAAIKDRQEAQEALTKAQEDASRKELAAIEDVRRARRDDAQNLADAEEALAWAKISGTSSDADVTKAAKELAKIKQDIADHEMDNQQKLSDVARQNAESIGNANDAVNEAAAKGAKSVGDATEALADSRAKGAKAIGDAQQKVIDTRAAGNASISDAEKSAADGAAAAAESHQGAVDKVADAQKSAGKAQQALEELQATGTATAEQLATAEAELADANEGVADAADNQADANDKAGQAGRDAAAAAYANKAATGDLAGAIIAANAEMEKQRAAFIASQSAADQASGAAAALADAQGLIPGDVTTYYTQSGIEANLTRVAAMNAELDKLNNRKVRFYVIGDTIQSSIDIAANGTLGSNTGPYNYGNTAPNTDWWKPAGYNPSSRLGPDNTDWWKPAKAEGGAITGPGGPTDDKIDIRVSNGEFIVNAAQTAKHRALLESINNGTNGYAAGGFVSSSNVGAGVTFQGTLLAPDVETFDQIWMDIASYVETAWLMGVAPAFLSMIDGTIKVGIQQVGLLTGAVVPSWGGIATAITDVVGALHGTVFPLAGQDLAQVAQWNSDLLTAGVVPSWTGILEAVATIVSTLRTAIFPVFNAELANLAVNNVTLATTTATAWMAIATVITTTYASVIAPMWEQIKGFQTSMAEFFNGIALGMTQAATSAVKDILTITTAINEFFKIVDAKAPVPATAAAAAASTTVGASVLALADGGYINVGTGPRADDVHIRASKGEYVVNAEATAQNRDLLDQINYGGAYADGGLIGDKIGNRVSNAVIDGSQRAISAGVDRLLASVPATSSGATSTATGFTSSQDPSSFGWVRAANQVPFSWQGRDFGLAANGTQGLWTALLNFIAPLIPGGINSNVGIFEDRSIAGTSTPSFHSYGLAMDINSDANGRGLPGYGRTGKYEIPGEPAHAIAAQLGMEWGGDWSYTDPMHFEIHVPPAGISAATPVAQPVAAKNAEQPTWVQSILDKIAKGGTGAVSNNTSGLIVSADPGMWGSTRLQDTTTPTTLHSAMSMSRGTAENVGPVPPGDAVERWRPLYLHAMGMLGKDTGAIDKMMYQMFRESSGNPLSYAIDNNYYAGKPSKGLLQTIPSTFVSNAPVGYNTNIWDPLSNALASLNYIGDPNKYPGGPYDNGGWLPTGISTVYNGLKAPEAVLTDRQWSIASSAMAQMAYGANNNTGGRQQIEITFSGDGVITQQMIATATVTVNGAMANEADVLVRMGGQS